MFGRLNSISWLCACYTVPHSSTDTMMFSKEACVKLLSKHSLCMSSATKSQHLCSISKLLNQ